MGIPVGRWPVDIMNDLKCPVHGTTLVYKEVPISYGMPPPDSEVFEIDSKFPYHGLWTLGGCVVWSEIPETEMELVCSDCNDAAKKL